MEEPRWNRGADPKLKGKPDVSSDLRPTMGLLGLIGPP